MSYIILIVMDLKCSICGGENPDYVIVTSSKQVDSPVHKKCKGKVGNYFGNKKVDEIIPKKDYSGSDEDLE